MPSPVKPSQICSTVVQGTSNLCAKFKSLLSLPQLLCDWFNYVYEEDGTFSSEFKTDMDAAGIGAPIGSIVFWLAPTVPDGWLILNGQQVSRTTYSALFSLWGSLHGDGNGSTTFTLPNMQGLMPIGSGQRESTAPNYVFNDTGGEDEHSLAVSELPSHTHQINTKKCDSVQIYGSALARLEVFEEYVNATDTVAVSPPANNIVAATRTTKAETGGGAAHENMPPWKAGYWIVRAL